jgi:tellurite resistance protein
MPKTSEAKPLDHHAALIYVMVTMSAVDRTMSDDELTRIGNLVSQLPVFRDFDENDLVRTAEACGKAISAKDGLVNTLDLVARSLPERLRETAYALAVEVAAADLKVQAEELRLLDMLRDKLDLSKLVVAAIERGARARHRVL